MILTKPPIALHDPTRPTPWSDPLLRCPPETPFLPVHGPLFSSSRAPTPKSNFLATWWFVVMGGILLVVNMCGCVSPATSYVKPSAQDLGAIRTLGVTVQGSPELSHTGAITEESSALMMIFGAPAVIADTAVRGSIDRHSAEAIMSQNLASKSRQEFVSTLIQALRKSQRFNEVRGVDGHKGDSDAVIVVTIVKWGSRVKKSGSDEVIPFVDLDISMNAQGNNKLIWRETQTVTHDARRTLDDYKRQKSLFGRDFAVMINKAGKRVAALLLDF